MAMSQADLTPRQEVTPPLSSTQQPLTPPPTDKKLFPTIERVVEFCKRLRAGEDTSPDPNVPFKLGKHGYHSLIKRLKREGLSGFIRDKLRFYYDDSTQTVFIRMPAEIHERFIRKVEGKIWVQIQDIASGSGKLADFATKVNPSGSAEIKFEDSKSRYHPDASFRYDGVKYPGVVIEVAYSQKKSLLNRLADNYLMDSNGNIRVVICFKLPYPKTSRRATLSVWRPKIFATPDGPTLKSVEEVKDQAFRDEQGNPVVGSGLQLRLSDFACEAFAKKELEDKNADIYISGQELCEYIKHAEDSVQGTLYVEPLDSTVKKRKRSPTPEDEIRSSDEAKYAKREALEEERAADDEDYEETSSAGNSSD